MSQAIGIIGGSGFYALADDTDITIESITTPYSELPVQISRQSVSGRDTVFLPRHGKNHNTPPHRVNYRANLWALKHAGAGCIIAVNVVGGITEKMLPGTIVIPDQVIDYTWGREHTFFDSLESAENHIDFTCPYDKVIANKLAESTGNQSIQLVVGGVYGCTQGPRLESAAEIRRLQQDGCDIVGMTGMPEAALARELDIPYACIALVVNWGAGIDDGSISFADIAATMGAGIAHIRDIVLATIPSLE